jgi:hypothetical protein
MWRKVTLHISNGEESLFTYMWCREESLFTFDVKRSLSSHRMWKRVTLRNRCGEESLFTFDVGSSHSSHSESLLKLAVGSSHSSLLMWRSHSSHFIWKVVTLHISNGEEYMMWRGVTLHMWYEEESLCGEESLFKFDVERSHSSHLMVSHSIYLK